MSNVTRVAAIDCGTNSIRLLVADADAADGQLHNVVRRMEIVRLGQGVDRSGSFSAEALSRTLQAVDNYAEQLQHLQPERMHFVATSATRDAANQDEFFRGVEQRLGVKPEVISGKQEATLSFNGAVRALPANTYPSPYLVVDVGGGSTEFIAGDAQGNIHAMRSVNVGCVRMTERHFVNDPPLPAEVSAARDDIEAAIALAAKDVPLRKTQALIALAGSATTVAALALGLWEYDRSQIHLAKISAAEVHRVCEDLLYMSRDKRTSNEVIHPGRVDVIAAGALVLSAVVAYTGVADIVISEHDILDGIAAQLAFG